MTRATPVLRVPSDDENNEYVEEDSSILAMDEEYDDHDDVIYGNDLILLADDQNKSVPVKVISFFWSKLFWFSFIKFLIL